ncbi:ATP-binding protein [Sphingomonas sp. M6A6_1c]
MTDLWRSAAYRIAFTYSAAFALAIAVLGASVYLAADAAFRHQLDTGIAEEMTDLARTYRTGGLDGVRAAIDTRRSGASNAYHYALFDAAGRRVAGALDTVRPPPGWSDIRFIDPAEGEDAGRALARPIGGATLVVAIDPESLERLDAVILLLFAGAFVIVLLLGTVGALILGRYLRLKLARIGDTALAIVAGDLSQRIPIGRRGDEFDIVATSVNAMLDRIAQLLDNLQQVSSDLAHDLRTPLSRLRGSLEAALDGPSDRTTLKAALRQSDDILALFAAILRISEVEGGGIGRSMEMLDVVELASDLCETYAPAVADGGRTLTCNTIGGALVRGDRELLAQGLINLLDNAQVHTPLGTGITLTVTRQEGTVLLSVEDDGPGVPATDRIRIVRRFVRLEESRSRPGNGLGLNLVAAIAALHRGRLVIEDNRPGLRAMLVLPAP